MLGRKPDSLGVVFAALVAVAVAGGCDPASTGPSSNSGNVFAAHIVAQTGNTQTGAVNAALALPITVKVTDASGVGIAGATVVFNVRTGGGSVSIPAATSGAGGIASTTWTLGATLGTQKLVAILNNGTDSATFTATGTQGPAGTITIISGNGQVGRSASQLASPLVVEVRDASGAVLPGVQVAFTEAASNLDAFVSATPVTTGADGRASVTWTLGQNTTNTTVPMSVTASPVGVPTVSVTFTATARPELRIRRDATPFLQSDTTGATIGSPGDYLAGVRDTLRVQVFDPTDSSGVQGVVVTWSGDGTTINATSVTDNKGFAKTLWALVQGGVGLAPSNIAKRMIASASMGQVEFQARVTPGRVCTIAQDAISGSTTVGSSVTVNATAKDCNGYPISGAVVSFSPSTGTATPVAVATDANGRASTTWALGSTTGLATMNVSASRQADPYLGVAYPTYSASSVQTINIAPLPPASITVSGAPASAANGTTTGTITLTVLDQNGAGVVGQAVTLAVSAGSVTPTSGTTGPGGTMTFTVTIGAVGANTVTITAGSVTKTFTITGT